MSLFFLFLGLQYQVDHHLFPMLPRHNLKKVNKLVASFCKVRHFFVVCYWIDFAVIFIDMTLNDFSFFYYCMFHPISW